MCRRPVTTEKKNKDVTVSATTLFQKFPKKSLYEPSKDQKRPKTSRGGERERERESFIRNNLWRRRRSLFVFSGYYRGTQGRQPRLPSLSPCTGSRGGLPGLTSQGGKRTLQRPLPPRSQLFHRSYSNKHTTLRLISSSSSRDNNGARPIFLIVPFSRRAAKASRTPLASCASALA